MDSDLPTNPEAHIAHAATAPPPAAAPPPAPPPPPPPPSAPAPAPAPQNHGPIQLSHPPYAEMIISAIKSLNEKKGSSRKAIAKFIDLSYTNLPQSHSALLTHHLKRLKRKGFVVMVKHSYKIPKSKVSATIASIGVGAKRGRGRPPKTNKPTVPVQSGSGSQKRSPGRPRKIAKPMVLDPSGPVSIKRGRGRPRKIAKPTVLDPSGPGSVKRGRGRPPKPKLNIVPGLKPVTQTGSRPRGRPRKDASAAAVDLASASDLASGLVTAPIAVSLGRPRGRPAKLKVGGPPKPKRVSTGRPVGRPKKVVSVVE